MIGIITTARSDFGLLKNLIKKIYNDKNFKLQIFVAGSHLSKRFGYTIKEIYKEKIFKIIKIKNISYSNSDIFIKLNPYCNINPTIRLNKLTFIICVIDKNIIVIFNIKVTTFKNSSFEY